MAEGKSGFSVAIRSIVFLVGIGFIALIVQVAINKPADRPRVLCLPPYKAFYFLGVSVPQVLIPREHLFAIKASRVATSFYHSCVSGTSKVFSISSSTTTEPGAQP